MCVCVCVCVCGLVWSQQAETRRQEARRTILDAEAQLLQQTAATSTFDYLRSQVEDALKSRTGPDANSSDNDNNNGKSEDLERLVAKQRHEIEVCSLVLTLLKRQFRQRLF